MVFALSMLFHNSSEKKSFNVQCDDRVLMFAYFPWKIRKAIVRLLSFIMLKNNIPRLPMTLNESEIYVGFTFLSDCQGFFG